MLEPGLWCRGLQLTKPSAAGATEAEITEAIEVGYLYGGTAALVVTVNAFRAEDPGVDAGDWLVARVSVVP